MAGGHSAATVSSSQRVGWSWHPPLPLEDIPVFVWPPRAMAGLKYLGSVAFLWSVVVTYGVIAAFAWFYLQPALERCVELRPDWILQMFARNLGLIVVIASAFHLYLITFKRQGTERKFDPRDQITDSPKFFARNQVWDNMFWTCASGVTVWTGYEVLFMWAYANDWLPYFLDWRTHPVWFVAAFFLIPFWTSFHFYFVHRLLHWRPLYRIAHCVHHRNENTGPWSGFSMHPVEHVIYLSSVLIHLVLMSHPIHILFHLQWNAIGAAVSHSGFESLTFRGKPVFYLMSFHHQLHHRYYDCNYGNPYIALDKWLGTNHDGTEESWAGVRKRRHQRLALAKNNA